MSPKAEVPESEMQLESQNSPFLSSPTSSSAPSPASPANSYSSSSSTSSSSYNEAGMAPISLSSARNPPEASGKTTSPEERPGDGRCTVPGWAIERVRFIDRVGGHQTGWKQVEERFDRIAWTGPGGFPVVDRSDFGHCIGMKETPEFADEILSALRVKKDYQTAISKEELQTYWYRISESSLSSRVRIFFDINMDGKITESDLKQVILLSASSNKLFMTNEEVGNYAAMIMEELDPQHKGYIELTQLETLFMKDLPKDCNNNNNNGSNHPSIATSAGNPSMAAPAPAAEMLFRTQWRRAWITLLWIIACISLFTWKFFLYRRRSAFEVMGYCLCTAKGAAETLKLNMALILLPVCRNTVTWARKHRWLSYIAPFNDNINLHKLIAGGIVVGVILHGGTHLACDFPRIARVNRAIFRRTIGDDFGQHQPSYIEILATTEGATVAMVILMAIAFLLATSAFRRDPSPLPPPIKRLAGFNTFWYSHHLFVLVYILLIVHSMFLFLTNNIADKTTWMYLAVPVLLYIGERTVRAVRAGTYDVNVIKASTYPGKVLSLKMKKPTGFKYRSGMYIFIKCPLISPLEWHPFSLTSSPDDDYLSVHIRTLGDWSYRIYSLFQEAVLSRELYYPKIHIDGPYGAASQDHVKYDVVMLIGLGIGATPFISVLKDIAHGLHKPNTNAIEDVESGISSRPLRVYFYWVTREQSSFDWFRDAMNEVSEMKRKQAVIEMHSFLTSMYKEGDARSALIAAIQALHRVKKGVDIVSKTPVRTHFSRPNWSNIFSTLAGRHGGERIGVFYCGPLRLARELQSLCRETSTKTTTRFVFHKENF